MKDIEKCGNQAKGGGSEDDVKFKWGQDFNRSYEENKKFWKEVRKGESRTE